MQTFFSLNKGLIKHIADYLTTAEHLPYGIAISKNDKHGTIAKANATFYKIIGHSQKEFDEEHGNRMINIAIDDFDAVGKMPTDKDYDVESDIRIKRCDNSVAWVHIFAHYNAKADVFFFVVTDISDKLIATARDLSHETFIIRNEVLSYISSHTSDHVIVVDIETDKIAYMNQSATVMFGLLHESDWRDKTYCELIFGKSTADAKQYNEPLTDTFTTRVYYNHHLKKYISAKNKLLNIPALNKDVRLIIAKDITAKKELESQIALQKTLYDCLDTMFTSTTTDTAIESAFDTILKQLRKYYEADRAFLYQFKHKTDIVDSFFESYNDNVQKKVDMRLPHTVTEAQFKQLINVSKFDVIKASDTLHFFSVANRSRIAILYKIYQAETFSCLCVRNKNNRIIAFMGVVNPKQNVGAKDVMELLSRFICMFIEHEQDDAIKEESLMIETLSKKNMLEICEKNFLSLTNYDKNISNTLEELCKHYDADFSVILLKGEDGACDPAYIAGKNIPNVAPIKHQASTILDKWIRAFDNDHQFISDVDFSDTNAPQIKRILNKNFGILNFVVCPIKDASGIIIGLLFLNNLQLANRSKLLVHVVAKNISDYLAKLKLHNTNQIEPLTKLANKTATEDLITESLKKTQKGAMFLLDIDNFKILNDSMGHPVGDQILIALSENLKKIFRIGDIVGRVGGDEFMVYSPGLIDNQSIINKCNQMLESSDNCHHDNNNIPKINVSIGACSVTESTQTFKDLYEKADYALYISKKQGKNKYHIYNDDNQQNNQTTNNELYSYTSIVKELQSAIKEDRLVVHYQPIYQVATNSFSRAEALVRIKKEDGTLVYPNKFIHIADSASVGIAMTYKILNQVCKDFRKLIDEQPNLPLKAIGINIPYLQFTDPLMEKRFLEILDRYDINPSQIRIELTERMLIKDVDLIIKKMKILQSKGFSMALDDFGVDYSNLQMCTTLPIETIKLDKSLLLSALATEESKHFFEHVIRGIHCTNRAIVIEGVETAEQLEWANKCNCDYIQGFYFSKSLDFNSFTEFLSK